jgi:hypothetical protein
MLAVLVGYCALIVLLLIGGALLSALLHGNHRSMIVGGTVVTFISGVISGGITARMAPGRPLAHATVLGLTIFTVLVIVTAISKRPPVALYPAWYPYASAFLAGAGAIFGGAVASGSEEPKGA